MHVHPVYVIDDKVTLFQALICFPGKADWEGPLDHFSNAMTSANLPVEGDIVKIKATVKEPHTGRWRGVIRNKRSRIP